MVTPKTAPQLPPLDIGKALHRLSNEVRNGRAHLNAAKSVAEASKSHPVIMSVSPNFFSLTTHAHLEASQLCAARLFDTQRDCASIRWLLRQVPSPRIQLPYSGLDKAIEEAERTCTEKEPVLNALKHRRDKWLAHLDKKTIRGPVQFAKDSTLTYLELEDLFDCAVDILLRIANLHGETEFQIGKSDYDDLPHTLELVEKGVEANAQELARRIGPCPQGPA